MGDEALGRITVDCTITEEDLDVSVEALGRGERAHIVGIAGGCW